MKADLLEPITAGNLARPIIAVLGWLRSRPDQTARYLGATLARSAIETLKIDLVRDFLSAVLLDEHRSMGTGPLSWFEQEQVLAGVGLLLCLSYLIGGWLSWQVRITRERLAQGLEAATLNRLVRHLLGLSMGFFDRQRPGELLQATREDVSKLRAVLGSVTGVFNHGLVLIGLTGALIFLNARLTLYVAIVLPLTLVPFLVVAARVRAKSFGERARSHAVFDSLLLMLGAMRVIKTSRLEARQFEGISTGLLEHHRWQLGALRLREASLAILEGVAGLSVAMVVMLGGYRVLHGELGWADFLAYVIAVRTMHGLIDRMSAELLQIQSCTAGVRRIADLLKTRSDLVVPSNPVRLGAPIQRIKLREVDFGYDDSVLLRSASIELLRGRTYGLAGVSGAEKTTLLALLARLYDPVAGSIQVDGVDLRQLDLNDLYGRVSLVGQTPFLFDDTVRNNILCGLPDGSDADVKSIVRQVQLHGDLVALPQGLETRIGVGGRGLSGGQAQRIELARALIAAPQVLLLDEVTAGLDDETEQRILEFLKLAAGTRITVIASHRKAVLAACDAIISVKDGRVSLRPSACGSPALPGAQ